MFNKLIYTLLILIFSGTLLTAQTQQTKSRRRKDRDPQTQQTAQRSEVTNTARNNGQDPEDPKNKKQTEQTGKSKTAAKKKDPQQEIRRLMRIDPRLPGPNAGEAKQILDQIKKDFIEREFPRKMQKFKAGTGSALILKITAKSYKKSLAHPDLEEATGIRLSWYNKAGAAFVALYKHLDEIERGAMLEQEKRYTAAAVKYMEMAKRLEKILDKPEKIPSKELSSIKENNIERRKQEIKKKINELMRQRRADR